jgi:hypothetical protein
MASLYSAIDVAVTAAIDNVELQRQKLQIVQELCSIQIQEAQENLQKAEVTLEAVKSLQLLLEPVPNFPPPSYQDATSNQNNNYIVSDADFEEPPLLSTTTNRFQRQDFIGTPAMRGSLREMDEAMRRN